MMVSYCVDWTNISPKEAIKLQNQLASKVKLVPIKGKIRYVAGVDLALLGPAYKWDKLIAGVVVYDMETGKVIERQNAIVSLNFPYIPGLLSFRETPGILKALSKLRSEVDVYMLDGQGIAHPRRLGIASHVGIIINKPTIGCAKSKLIGKPTSQLLDYKGSVVYLEDGGEIIGAEVRTKDKVKPVYISPGHLITMDESIEIALRVVGKYRLPEPTRLAHIYVTELSRKLCRGRPTENYETLF